MFTDNVKYQSGPCRLPTVTVILLEIPIGNLNIGISNEYQNARSSNSAREYN